MYYRQKFDCFIRIYEDIGYITNKSDFSDRVVSKSGSVFLSALGRQPQHLDDLAKKIIETFVGVDIETIKSDVKEFYDMLEQDGFLVSGYSVEECDSKDTRFSYQVLEPKTIKSDFTPKIMRAEKNTQVFLEEHFKEHPKLSHCTIEITSKCNEKCIHCYIPQEFRTNEMKPQLFYDVLEQCKTMGVLGITLSGGEPMLHKDFCEFLRKCKEYDFSVNIVSNLTLLTDEIITELKNNRLSGVQVSLYSMKSEIHDMITKLNGSFDKTLNAITKLVENDIPLQISCPVMKQNKNCYIDVLIYSNTLKVRAVTDYIMVAKYDRTTQNLVNRLSLEDLDCLINNIIENDVEYQRQIINGDFLLEGKRDISNDIVCGVCISSICMDANGNVYPCSSWQGYVLGNATETSLQEIWDNSERVKYLRGLRMKDFPKCLTCDNKAFCAMCMVRNANESLDGNPLTINQHFCDVAKLNKDIVSNWKEKLKD